MTFLAPPLRCFSFASIVLKAPVHSKTMSIFNLSQGNSSGLRPLTMVIS
jgi:hypothetical protein